MRNKNESEGMIADGGKIIDGIIAERSYIFRLVPVGRIVIIKSLLPKYAVSFSDFYTFLRDRERIGVRGTIAEDILVCSCSAIVLSCIREQNDADNTMLSTVIFPFRNRALASFCVKLNTNVSSAIVPRPNKIHCSTIDRDPK